MAINGSGVLRLGGVAAVVSAFIAVSAFVLSRVDESQAAEAELLAQAERLERELDQIQTQIERATRDGDERTIERLRAEGDKLLDQLEEIERMRPVSEKEEDDDGENVSPEEQHREIELARMELEIERLHHELQAVQLDIAERQSHLAQDEIGSAAAAIRTAKTHMDPEEFADFLVATLEQAGRPPIQRILQRELAATYFELDRRDEAKRLLRVLILAD